jgi:hypothetical protein
MSATPTTDERLLTADELAERWQIVCKSRKAEAVWAMVRRGEIPAGAVVRLGQKKIRFRLAGIEEFEARGGNLGGDSE